MAQEQQQAFQFKKGAYIVHVFVEELRGLIAKSEDSTVDPIVQCTVFGKKRYTKQLDDVGSTAAVWLGEHLFFMESHLEVAQVERAKLLVEVVDHRFLGKNALIGNYELDLVYVYTQEEHCLRHTWIALTNTDSDDFSEVRGYVKLGINVIAEGDVQADLATEEIKEQTEGNILMPPCIQQTGHQIQIRLMKGECFAKMDRGDQCDPYVIVNFNGRSIKGTMKSTKGPSRSAYWYEDYYIPVQLPCVTGTVELQFWDYDQGSKDDLIGFINFKFTDIKEGKYKEFFWANIYGAHGDLNNEEAIKMNKFPDTASSFKGRILLKLWSYDEKKPKLIKSNDIPQKDLDLLKKYEEGCMWELRAMVFNGTALPKAYNGYKLGITVSCGDSKLKSEKVKSQNGRCDWFQNLNVAIEEFPIKKIEEMPDVYVYLTYDAKFICFYRFQPKALTDVHKEDF